MLVLDANEPAALIGALKRVAELKALSGAKGEVTFSDAWRWQRLAEVLQRVDTSLHEAGELVNFDQARRKQ